MEFEFSNVRKCVIILFQYFEEAIHFCSNPHGYMEITENEGIAKNIVRAIYYLAFPSFLTYVLQCFKFKDVEWLFWENIGCCLSIGWISWFSYLVIDVVVNRTFRPRAIFNYLVVVNFLLMMLMSCFDSIYLVTECIAFYYVSVLSVFVGVMVIVWYYLLIFFKSYVRKIFGVIGLILYFGIFHFSGIAEELLMHTRDVDIFEDKVACEYYDLVHGYVFLMPNVGKYCDEYSEVADYSLKTYKLLGGDYVGLYTVDELCNRFDEMKKKWNCRREDWNSKLGTEKTNLVSMIALMKYETNKSIFKQYYVTLETMEEFFNEYEKVFHLSFNIQNCDMQKFSAELVNSGKKLTQLHKNVVDEYLMLCQLRADYVERLNWREEHLFFYCPFATENMINEKVKRKLKSAN